jgi:hypothetical protein
MDDESKKVEELADRIERRKAGIREHEQEQETEKELQEIEERRDTAPYPVPEAPED